MNPQLDPEVRRLAVDSREVEPGDLFLALTGGHSDAHRWVGSAVERGAVALVLERGGELPDAFLEPPPALPILIANDSRSLLAELANRFNGYPTEKLEIVAVTGTNGKTTVTALLEQILRADQRPVGVIGTLFFRMGRWEIHGRHTTPQAHQLYSLLRAFLDRGARVVVMEASSHGLALRRLDGAQVDVGIFTNLSLDHLDFHADMEDYFAAKRRLFAEFLPAARAAGKPGVAVINADDPWGERLLAETSGPLVRYGLTPSADVRAESLELTPTGSRFELVLAAGSRAPVALSMVGRHNVLNALAAAAAAEALGVSIDVIATALSQIERVRGRLEPVARDDGLGPTCFVDYAHTPDALARVLEALRETGPVRLCVVFGCGGDRDRSKRPEMGRIAAERADVVVVTNDNPRSEDPDRILDAIVAGIESVALRGQHWRLADRRRAIAEAVAQAGSNDIVLIAGKGHETTQEIAGSKLPFDDVEVTREALAAWTPLDGGAA